MRQFLKLIAQGRALTSKLDMPMQGKVNMWSTHPELVYFHLLLLALAQLGSLRPCIDLASALL